MIADHHPVLALLKERIASHSQPGARSDSFKLGLAIEGGGMRGVVSCAMAAEIARLGGYDAFDAVYGTSAGAFAGSFFVARQMHMGPSMYYDDLNNASFIAWRRLLLRRPVLDLSFLVDHGLTRLKPLDWHHVAYAKVPLHIIASSLKQGRATVINRFRTKADLLDALRASSTVPYLAGPPVPYHDDLLFDGGLFEPLPIRTAVGDGCTHVLVLCSRPRGRFCKPPTRFQRSVIEPRLRKLSPATAESFLTINDRYRELMTEIEHASAKPTAEGPHLCAIQLSGHHKEIDRLEKNRDRLLAGAAAGTRAVQQALGEP